MISHASKAHNENLSHVKGVKGPSITALIPHFDVAKSFVPDYMHAILLGSRSLFSLWFDSKNKNRPFYIKKKKYEQK